MHPDHRVRRRDPGLRGRGGGAAAVAGAGVRHRRPLAAARRPAPRPDPDGAPPGWVERGAARHRARDRVGDPRPLPRRRVPGRVAAGAAPISCGSWNTWSAARTWRSTSPCSRKSWRCEVTTVARRSGEGRRRARRRVPGRDHRRGHVGPAHRAPARPGRRRLRDPGEERRRRRHLVREPVSRAAGSTTPTTTTATRSRRRHDWPLYFSTQDVLLDYFRTCARRVRPARAHPLRDRGASATWDDTEASWTLVAAHRRRRRRHRRRARGRERGRPAQPAELPRHPGPRHASPAPRSTRPGGTTTYRLDGERVAVIGTGASSVQFTPEIARRPRT